MSGRHYDAPPRNRRALEQRLRNVIPAQLGHTDPTVTLGIYAQAMTSSDDDRERLRLLVEGDDLAVHSSVSESVRPGTIAAH